MKELKKEWFENKHLLSANSTNEEIADWWIEKTNFLLAKQQEEFVNETIKLMKREYMRGLIDSRQLYHELEQLENRYNQYIKDNPSVIADIKSKLK